MVLARAALGIHRKVEHNKGCRQLGELRAA